MVFPLYIGSVYTVDIYKGTASFESSFFTGAASPTSTEWSRGYQSQ
jgi:hypothetical protein